jgi:hypothetical protein
MLEDVPDGEFVLYTDHLAALAEKDKEIERLRTAIEDKSKEDSEGEDNQARPFCLACLGKGGYYTYRFNGPNVWKDCRVCKRTVKGG